MDNLFVEVFRRSAARMLGRQAEALTSEQPLWALWDLIRDQTNTALNLQFLALGSHRKAVMDEMKDFSVRFRRLQFDELSKVLVKYGVDTELWPPEAVMLFMDGVARFMLEESAYGLNLGHDQAEQRGRKTDRRVRRKATHGAAPDAAMTLRFRTAVALPESGLGARRLGRALPLAPRSGRRLRADGIRPRVAHRAPLHRRRLLTVAVSDRCRYRRTDPPDSHRDVPIAAPAAQSGPGRRGYRHAGSHLRRPFRPWRRAGLPARGVRRSGHPRPRARRTDAGKSRRSFGGYCPAKRSRSTVAYTKLHDIRISPPALQRPHPPIWVGGTAPQRHRASSQIRLSLPERRPRDRPMSTMPRCAPTAMTRTTITSPTTLPTYVAPTREQAWEFAARPLHYMASGYLQWTSEAKGATDSARSAALPSVDEIVRKQSMDFFGEAALVGTPADVIAQIEDYRSRSRLTDLVCAMALPGMPAHQIRGWDGAVRSQSHPPLPQVLAAAGGSGNERGQGIPSTQRGGRRHASVVGVDLPLGEALEDLLQGDPAFEPRQRLTQAVMGAEAEGEMLAGITMDVEAVAVRVSAVVVVGRAEEEQHDAALGHRLPVYLCVSADVAGELLRRGLQTQHLLDGVSGSSRDSRRARAAARDARPGPCRPTLMRWPVVSAAGTG